MLSKEELSMVDRELEEIAVDIPSHRVCGK
jgi:hypothetical protein